MFPPDVLRASCGLSLTQKGRGKLISLPSHLSNATRGICELDVTHFQNVEENLKFSLNVTVQNLKSRKIVDSGMLELTLASPVSVHRATPPEVMSFDKSRSVTIALSPSQEHASVSLRSGSDDLLLQQVESADWVSASLDPQDRTVRIAATTGGRHVKRGSSALFKISDRLCDHAPLTMKVVYGDDQHRPKHAQVGRLHNEQSAETSVGTAASFVGVSESSTLLWTITAAVGIVVAAAFHAYARPY
jgi:hypothetical protein